MYGPKKILFSFLLLCSYSLFAEIIPDDFESSTLGAFWNQMGNEDLKAPPNDLILSSGELTMGVEAHSDPWYQGAEGFFLYQNHTGTFDIRTTCRVRSWSNPNADSNNSYAFGGLMIRNPVTRDYIFVVIGERGGSPQVETKNTNFPSSNPRGFGVSGPEMQLRLVREADGSVKAYSRSYSASSSTSRTQRSISTNSGPADFGNIDTNTVQVGLIGYGYLHPSDFRAIFTEFAVEDGGSPIATVNSFNANPSTLLAGFGPGSTLSWDTSNASTVTIDQGIGSVSADGSLVVNPLVTTTYTLTADDGENTDTETVTITVIEENMEPVADAGSDTSGYTNDTVTLDGTQSSDPDSLPEPLSYSWVQNSGPVTVSIDNANEATASFSSLGVGTYTFELTVSDGQLSSTDTVEVTLIEAPPQTLPPEFEEVTPLSGVTGVPLDTPIKITFNKPVVNTQWSNGTLRLYKSNDELVEAWDITDDDLIDAYHLEIQPTQPLEPDTTYYLITQGSWLRLGTSPWSFSEQVEEGDWVFSTSTGSPIVTIDNFNASPTSFSENNPVAVTLSWETSNATSVSIDQGIGSVSEDGSTTVSPISTTTYTLTASDSENTTNQAITVTVIPNQAPTANAGADQSHLTDTTITLDGSASSDSDSGPSPLSYAWSQISGPTVTLNNSNQVSANFTSSLAGTYTFELQVSDGALSSTDQVSVTLTEPAANISPIANAGADQSVNTNNEVTLNGSASSDPDSGPSPLSYSWTQISGPVVSLSNSSIASPTFTPTTAGSYTFELTVSDGDLDHSDSVNITVIDPPPQTLPPEFEEVTPLSGSTGVSINTPIKITFNKPVVNTQWSNGTLRLYKSNDELVEAWDITDDDLIDAYHLEIQPTQPLEPDTTYYLITQGSWLRLGTSPWSFSEPVEEGDWVFTTESGDPVATIDSFNATPSSFSENNPVAVTLSWETSNATSVSIDQGIGSVSEDGSTTVSPISTTTYTLTASDSENTTTQAVTVTVIPNQAPTANAGADQSDLTDTTITLDGSASSDSDSGPSPLSYAWSQISGPAVTLNNSNQASANFISSLAGTYTFELQVSDGALNSTDQVSVTLTEPAANVSPIANAGADQSVNTNNEVTLNGSVSTDPDSGPSPLTYSWTQTSGPSVSLSNASIASPTFTPTTAGSYTFELTVSDGDLDHSDSVNITVIDPPPQTLPPEFEEVTPLSGSTGVSINTPIKITFNKPVVNTQWSNGTLRLYKSNDELVEAWDITDDDLIDAYHLEIQPTQPLELDTTYYLITQGSWLRLGTSPWSFSEPVEEGDWVFTTESGDPVATIDSFNATPSSFSENNPVEVTLSWETTDTTSVSIDQGIGSVSEDGSLSVFPTVTTAYTLTATDGVNTETQIITVTVTPNQAPNANAGTDQSELIDTTIILDGSSSSDSDSGPSPLSYAWSQISGPAVTLNNSNQASANFISNLAGTYTFELQVSDGALNSTDQVSVTLTEPAANVAPIANAGADQSVVNGDTVILDGTGSSDPDSGPLPITYFWLQTAGPTMILSGVDTSNPSFLADINGTVVFELTVNDGDLTHTDTVTITINEPVASTLPHEIDSVTPANGSTGVALDTHLIINFNTPIYNDSFIQGHLKLYKTDGDVLVESWDIQNSQIPDSYTIDITLSQPLEPNTSYYIVTENRWIKLATSPWNISGNIEEGDWSFTTGE